MKAYVSKCPSLVLQEKQVTPSLFIGSDKIPPPPPPPPKPTVSRNAGLCAHHRHSQMLSLTTHQQKLRLFKHGVGPRLSWPLLVEDFPLTWLERELQPLPCRSRRAWPHPPIPPSSSCQLMGFIFRLGLCNLVKGTQSMYQSILTRQLYTTMLRMHM